MHIMPRKSNHNPDWHFYFQAELHVLCALGGVVCLNHCFFFVGAGGGMFVFVYFQAQYPCSVEEGGISIVFLEGGFCVLFYRWD